LQQAQAELERINELHQQKLVSQAELDPCQGRRSKCAGPNWQATPRK
jgi:multidrug resistance efflux pump